MNGFKIPPQAGFENLLNKGLGFLSMMAGQQQQRQQQQQQQGWQGGDFFRNMFQNNGFQGCSQQQRCQPDPRC